MNTLFVKSYKAEAAIQGSRIVMHGVGHLSTVTANSDEAKLMGVSDSMGAQDNGMCDVHRIGIQPVRAGGTFENGDHLTSDAQGRAIKAVPVAGKTISIIGTAETDAVEDDLALCFLAPSLLHTPA